MKRVLPFVWLVVVGKYFQSQKKDSETKAGNIVPVGARCTHDHGRRRLECPRDVPAQTDSNALTWKSTC